jgi:uncharacterized delta-60 repeat protein
MKIQTTTVGHFSLKMSRFPLFLLLVAIISGLAISALAQGGTLDTTFGTGGRVIVSTPSNALGSRELDSVLQADGRIVSLMNPTSANTNYNSIVRLTADGNPDPSFGNGGFRDIVWSQGLAFTLAKQNLGTQFAPDERFVIAGNANNGPNSSYMRIERYTNAGALDTTFGVSGVASFNITAGVCASAVQPDQKIVIGCSSGTLVRLNANGTPDTTFGSGGVSTANLGITIRDVYSLPDGRTLVFGDVVQGKGRNIVLARVNPNGTLDDGGRNDMTPGDSFGKSGKSTVSLSLTQTAVGITFDPATGNIYGVGEAQIGGNVVQSYDAIILRFNYAGQLDQTFGQNGRAVLNIANEQDEFSTIALFNGKIIVAGEGRVGGGVKADYLVARYNLNGSLDTSFGNNGVVLYNFLNDYDHASNLFIQADPGCGGCAKLIVTGGVWTGPSPSPLYTGVLRFLL